ncbi:DNA/RNA nuclease SfsA [Pelosinus sp. sgz500959]|uniref:DNA/RNA nuclease SfsA n=1 Tax=Pelosinus sp. sgz500959 TaxID=3242472 RepID=UPI00366CCA90
MKYTNIVQGIFIKRVNRFIAHVLINHKEHIVHVKNTGRCKELLIAGAVVILEPARTPERKTAFSLIAVYKGERLINMDSQVPNHVVFEAMQAGGIPEISVVRAMKKEVTYGNSRFDIYFESDHQQNFIEVKGVTLEEEGIVMFPDAPTSRGTKHIYEMIKAVEAGYGGTIFFLIQMKDVHYFRPNVVRDPEFAQALTLAAAKGVKLLAYDSVVHEDEIVLGDRVPIFL